MLSFSATSNDISGGSGNEKHRQGREEEEEAAESSTRQAAQVNIDINWTKELTTYETEAIGPVFIKSLTV